MDGVLEIREKHNNQVIDLSKCSIDKIVAKYSNTKTPVYKLIVDNKVISRNNTLLVTFTCKSCLVKRTITLNLYMRRLQKDTKTCYLCVNKSSEKREAHSTFMKDNFDSIQSHDYVSSHEKLKIKTLSEHIEYSCREWNSEDINFVNHYNLVHLDTIEFARILPKIKGVGNGKITDLSNWIYFPYYRVFNQTRFTPMLVNDVEQLVEKPSYITFECENCENIFTHRDLEIVKNKLKIYCQTCTLTNKSFKLRPYTLKDGTKILWQSIPERRFIEWCEEQRIIVRNGPQIDYIFNKKSHKYRVDFELPLHKKIIEIKDNHCWHQQQLASGKFGAKETAAKNWCIEKGYTFDLIFPKNLQHFKDSIKTS